MSKTKKRRHGAKSSVVVKRSQESRAVIKVSVIVGVLLCTMIGFSAYVSHRAANESAALRTRSMIPPIPMPTPDYSASAPAKEFIYAGSKLLAVSEPVQPAPSDLAVWRLSSSTGVATWWVMGDGGTMTEQTWGQTGDKPAPADFDGDGKTDFCIYRPTEDPDGPGGPQPPVEGKWYVINSSTNTSTTYWFGEDDDMPVPADFDGDSRADLALFRPTLGKWFVQSLTSGGITERVYGQSGDKPIPSDFDGDGKADMALWRNSDATWYIWQSGSNSPASYQWGASGDTPVPGDYDGDLKTDYAVWKSDNKWTIRQSSDGTTMPVSAWGLHGSDIAVQGDYDSDGRTDKAVWRPSDGTWYIVKSSNGNVRTAVWGVAGDIPVPAPYRR